MNELLSREQAAMQERPVAGALAQALAAGRRAVVSRPAETVCAALLLLMSLNMLSVIARKSITADEVVMIPAAYYYLVAGDLQLIREHPPLSKLLAAIPLLFIQPHEVSPQQVASIERPGERSWAYQALFWGSNREQLDTISFWARVPMIALTLALGVVIFLYARQLFGARAAVLAVALYSLEPTVLAHGRVVQTDIPAACGYLLVFLTLNHYLRAPAMRRALWLGLASGFALLTKFSLVILGPLLGLLALVWFGLAPRYGQKRLTVAAHAGFVALAALLVVNAAYFFALRPLSQQDADWIVSSFPSSYGAILWSLRLLTKLLPAEFLLGIFWQLKHGIDGHPASLLGMHSHFGWWYYFPVAFALKTTLPFLLLSLAALGWALDRLFRQRERMLLALIVPLAIYTAAAMLSTINIGVRYFLPAFPFLFILGGALLDRLLRAQRARRAGQLVALLLLCWIGAEAVRAYPDHMSYMNQLAWQHPPYHYLSDSNVEWGDDVRDLAAYLRARGETRARAILLGGYATLGHYGVEYMDALALSDPAAPETRYIAIGASFLNGSTVPGRPDLTEEERVNFFAAYRQREPEAVFGGSIYLYRVRD